MKLPPKQIEKDKRFIEDKIKPRVAFVDSFKKLNGRLPSQHEFKIWQHSFLYHDCQTKPFTDSLIREIDSCEMDGEYIRSENDIPDELKPLPKNIDWSKNYALYIWRGEWSEYYTSWNNHYLGNNSSWAGSVVGLVEMLFVGVLPFLVTSIIRKYRKR